MIKTDTLFMDAILTPNRPLSRTGMKVVLTIVFVVSLVAGSAFLSMGAFPVMGFFGLDAMALWWALRWSRHHQSQATHIQIDRSYIRLAHRDARGRTKHAELPTAFTRVELERPAKPHSWLSLAYGRRVLIIGRFLTPSERESFADALHAALASARAPCPGP